MSRVELEIVKSLVNPNEWLLQSCASASFGGEARNYIASGSYGQMLRLKKELEHYMREAEEAKETRK